MSEDYFDDTSDADFLALAQKLDSRGDGSSIENAGSGSSAITRSAVPKITSSRNSSARKAETTRPDTSKTAARVLRPGFNAVIVNTRQVHSLHRSS